MSVRVHLDSIGLDTHRLPQVADRERDILALKYGAGISNRAIARLTGLSESNVGTILSRTLVKLRAAWAAGGMP